MSAGVLTPPAYLYVPDGAAGSYGDEVADFAELVGRPLDPTQRVVVEALTSYRPGGDWLTLESCVKMGRQSGKTGGIVTPIVLADLFLWGAERIVWTAHLFKTTRDAFADHLRLIESTPELDAEVAKVVHANGEESIILGSGARLEYLARSKGGGRGLGGKRVVIDEALFFTGEQAGALLPTLAARRNPQIMFASSACLGESDYLRSLTRRGRSGSDPGLAFVEFCAPGGWESPGCEQAGCQHLVGTPGCSLDNEDLLRAANPGVGAGRVSIGFLRGLRLSMAHEPVEFGREFLGWDEDEDTPDAPPLTEADWRDRADASSRIVGPIAIGVDVHPNRSSASIAVAGRREDGKAHVELAHSRAGTSWLPAEVARMLAEHDVLELLVGTGDDAVMVPAVVGDEVTLGPLLEAFEAVEVRPVVLKTADLGRACSRLLDAVKADDVRHPGQVQVTAALGAAAARPAGDGGWAWGKRKSSGVDISGLVAVTNAHDALCRATESEVWGFWD